MTARGKPKFTDAQAVRLRELVALRDGKVVPSRSVAGWRRLAELGFVHTKPVPGLSGVLIVRITQQGRNALIGLDHEPD